MITTSELNEFDLAMRRKIAERIKEEMKKKKLSPYRLSVLAEVSQHSVEDILKGKNWTVRCGSRVMYCLGINVYVL